MRRYTSLLLAAFILLLIAVAGSAYLSGYADRAERAVNLPVIDVYTTLPAENAALLAAEYERFNQVRVNFVPISAEELVERINAGGSSLDGDMILSDSEILRKAAADGLLDSYISEAGDSVSENFKDTDGMWTGVWYDPVVFCVNRDYLKSLMVIPKTWPEMAAYPGGRIGITDFLAADASADVFFSLLTQYGDKETFKMLRQFHPKVVQYSKYLSTPVRMAGMNEVDVSIAVQSETLRYINEGYPLRIVYPEDGTAYILMATGMLKGYKNPVPARRFADWLLGDDAQLVLQSNNFFFVPTNPGTLASKQLAVRNIKLFESHVQFSSHDRHALLDRWVKNIRIN